MKKLKYILITIFTLFILVACSKKQKLGDVLNLKEENIKKIIVETTLTKNKSDIVLDKKEYKKFLDKISSYDILEKKDDNKAGWQYLIKIKSEKDIQFSIMENKIYLNGKMYISNNLNKKDFLYLFKK